MLAAAVAKKQRTRLCKRRTVAILDTHGEHSTHGCARGTCSPSTSARYTHSLERRERAQGFRTNTGGQLMAAIVQTSTRRHKVQGTMVRGAVGVGQASPSCHDAGSPAAQNGVLFCSPRLLFVSLSRVTTRTVATGGPLPSPRTPPRVASAVHGLVMHALYHLLARHMYLSSCSCDILSRYTPHGSQCCQVGVSMQTRSRLNTPAA